MKYIQGYDNWIEEPYQREEIDKDIEYDEWDYADEEYEYKRDKELWRE